MPRFLQKIVAGALQVTGGSPAAGKVLTSDASGNATWQSAAGGNTYTASSSPPASPVSGDVWFDTDTAIEYTYIADGTSNQWVEVRPAGTTGPAGATGAEGGTTTLTTKGDLLGRTASTIARVPVGTDGQVLTAASAQTTGVQWSTLTGDRTVFELTSTSGAIANTETVVSTYTIPANSLAAGDTFLFKAFYVRAGTNAAQAIARVRVGTTTLAGTIPATITFPQTATATAGSLEALVTFRTVGAAGTVLGSMINAHNTASIINVVTTAVAANTTNNLIIELTVISGNATNTYTFYNATITRLG